MKAAADSPTRLDKDGNAQSVPFRFFSLKAGEFTEGLNIFGQPANDQPVWMRVAELLVALGLGGADKHSNGDQRPTSSISHVHHTA